MRYRDEMYVVGFAFLFLLIMVLSTRSYGMIPRPKAYKPVHACNQTIYDELYWSAVEIVLNAEPMTDNEIALKNSAIETLRRLCNGQKSTFEKKNPGDKLRFPHGKRVD